MNCRLPFFVVWAVAPQRGCAVRGAEPSSLLFGHDDEQLRRVLIQRRALLCIIGISMIKPKTLMRMHLKGVLQFLS